MPVLIRQNETDRRYRGLLLRPLNARRSFGSPHFASPRLRSVSKRFETVGTSSPESGHSVFIIFTNADASLGSLTMESTGVSNSTYFLMMTSSTASITEATSPQTRVAKWLGRGHDRGLGVGYHA